MRAGLCALAFLAPAAGLAAASPAAAQPVEQFYRDHPISMLVGFGPGGGYDAYTRLLAAISGGTFRAILRSSFRTCRARPA